MPATAPEPAPTTADRALLRCLRLWGEDRTWSRLAPALSARLRAVADPTADAAELLRDHTQSVRPDPKHVHPSWFIRALRPESQAVRGTVIAHATPTIRQALGSDETDPVAAFPADPAARDWALTLWSERLVGDVPPRADDPLVIVALTQLTHRDQARLAKVVGQVKHAFAIRGHGPDPSAEASARLTPLDRVRLGYFRRLIGVADPRLVPLARADLAGAGGDPRRVHARLGLVTLGRLLATTEPNRARWALQHIPYPVAKLARSGAVPGFSPRALSVWEGWVLEAAWARLLAEGRLAAPPSTLEPTGEPA